MRYDDIPPAIIRRALHVWLSNQNDKTPVLFRYPDVDDEAPYYMINWFMDDQNPDAYYLRDEQLMITSVVDVNDGLYGAADRKTKAIDFFQRGQDTVDDCNRFIQYLVSEGSTIPYSFKAFEIIDGNEEISWSDDGLTLSTPFFVRYTVSYEAESLSKISGLTDNQIRALDT